MTTVPTDTPDTAALQTVGTADHLAEATVVLVGPTAPTVLVVMVHLEAVMAVAVVATAATSSGTVVLVGMTTEKRNVHAISQPHRIPGVLHVRSLFIPCSTVSLRLFSFYRPLVRVSVCIVPLLLL